MLLSKIKESANKVFQQLGPGHSEKIYHKALGYELASNKFNITNEYHVPIKYLDSNGIEHILESERIDIFIHDYPDIYNEIDSDNLNNKNIILELKAISKTIQDQEKNQVKKYIRQLNNLKFKYGIVINFPQSFSKPKQEIEFIVVDINHP